MIPFMLKKKKTFCKHTYINKTAWRKIQNVTHQTVDGVYLWEGECEKDLFFSCMLLYSLNKKMSASAICV